MSVHCARKEESGGYLMKRASYERLLSSSAEQFLMRVHCCALSSVHQCAVCTVLLMRVHCALCCVDCCAPLCTVLLMRLHCAADKGARRPLDEKVAKNFYKSPHLRNTSKQPTMKKIYKRYIAMSKISHIIMDIVD